MFQPMLTTADRMAGRAATLALVALLALLTLSGRGAAAEDVTPPILLGAAVDRAVLSLTYDEPLDAASVPEAADYSVVVNDLVRGVSGVGISGDTVSLTLASRVASDDVVTLDYTPGAAPVQDAAGNAADSFVGVWATNNTAYSTPGPVSAQADRALLTLTYDEALDELSVPAPGDFSALVNDVERSVSTVGVSGSTVTLTLSSRVANGDDVILTYTPGANAIQDREQWPADGFASLWVENATAYSTPGLLEATVNGSTLRLRYDEPLDAASMPAPSDFGVLVGDAPRAVSTVAVSGDTVALTLASPVNEMDDVYVSYTRGANPIRDTEEWPADSFSGVWVVNNTLPPDEPETYVTDGPSRDTNSRTAQFMFESNRDGSTFECKLDTGAWAPCTSPRELVNVADGAHTFAVRATDPAGKLDSTPATHTWTVDTVLPSVSLTAPADGAAVGGVVTLSAEASDNTAVARVAFLVDGAVVRVAYAAPYGVEWDSSTVGDGTHTIVARAEDAGGNRMSSAARTVTVGNPPDTTIDAGPLGVVRRGTATFAFSASEAGATFECRLDAGGWTACASPRSYANLANTEHTFEVRAFAGGETDPSPASRTWTVDASGILVEETSSTLTPHDLAHLLLGPQSEVQIMNTTHTGSNIALGKFSGGSEIIGFEGGIMLSSGDIANAAGRNREDGISHTTGSPGDAALTALSGYSTRDASVLEFDFIPKGDKISVQYVFASDEYNEFVKRSFNDVFGFIVNGVNCAVVGGNAVSVDTINLNSNAASYRNNDLDDGGGAINTEMDGLTTVLTCTAPVTPGQMNHMKLAIADASDSILDSNVFLKSGSFVSLDTEAPSVSLTAPAGGSTVRGAVLLSADASDNVGVDRVEFLAGGAVIGSDATAPYGVSWDSTAVADGAATITARAVDTSGNSRTSAGRTVTVDNTAPNTTITDGPSGVVGSTTASFSFSSEPGATFQCKLDSQDWSGCAAPKEYQNLSQGEHTFRVRATDAAGNTDQTPASRTWTVDTTAPTVTAVSPADTATAVLASENVTATFSEAMNGATLTTTSVTLIAEGAGAAVPAAVTYDAPVRTVTLDPSAALDPSTLYTATIRGGSGGATDTSGVPLAADHTWTFTTADLDEAPSLLYAEVDGSTLVLQYSEILDDTSVPAAARFVVKVNGAAQPAPAHVEVWGDTVVLTLEQSVIDTDVLTVSYTPGVDPIRDLTGNDAAALTNEPVRNSTPNDPTPPTVSLTAPAASARVRGAVTISATATDDVEMDRVEFLVNGVVVGTDADDSNGYSVIWNSASGADGAKTIVARAHDTSSNRRDSAGRGVTVDNTAPTVTASAPAAGATNVALDANVTATFSEGMDPATITASSVTLVRSGTSTAVAATVTYDATSRIATLNPGANLAGNATYTATVKGGAAGARDLAGNALAANKTWQFTTLNPDTTPPTVALTAPAAGAWVRGSVALSATATDNVGVQTVEFLVDGVLVGADTTAPYGLSWNSAAAANGAKTITARAVDAAGNAATASRSVTADNTKPVMGAVTQSLVLGQRIATSTTPAGIPVKVVWSATDTQTPASQISFQVQRHTQTNGVWGAWTTVAFSPATARTLIATLPPGTHQFQVLATDLAGNASAWKLSAIFTLGEAQETSTAIAWSASPAWSAPASLTGAYGGKVKYSSVTGATARFTFTGRNVAWVAQKGSNRGKAEVYDVTGGTRVLLATVDLYSGTASPAQLVYVRSWTTSATRIIEVRVLGTKHASSSGTRVDADAFTTLR